MISLRKINLFFIIIILFLSTLCYAQDKELLERFDSLFKGKGRIPFSFEEWKEIRDKKEKKEFKRKETILYKLKSKEVLFEKEEKPPVSIEKTGIYLPYESKLNITGKKVISIKGTGVYFFKPEKERSASAPTPTKGFEMNQELQVKITGKVGRKITVEVDYDDTQENKRKMFIVYKGDENEILQNAAFGDITLELPATEFVSYRKSVYGLKADARYKSFKLMGIFSQTKGIPEFKKFTGKSSFEKRSPETNPLKDINYISKTYYRVDKDHTQLPIEVESEVIYLDDQDGTNNVSGSTMTVRNIEDATVYEGYFDRLNRGQDYIIDYEEGVIKFKRSLQQNYVIAITYKDNTSTSITSYNQGYPLIIKDEKDTLKYELKNYYNLGKKKILRTDFIIKLLNSNREEVQIPSYEIDYNEGILRFTDEKPFPEEDIYSSNPVSHYYIYVEYYYTRKTYNLRPNIVEGSEKISLDGKPLKRDIDYFLDYESGFITFYHEDDIKADSVIEINYEYAPWLGQYQQTLVGLRGEFAPSDDFFLGSTYLYSGSPKPQEIPSISSTAKSTEVIDINSKISLYKGKYYPFNTNITAEGAQSSFNPNISGKALIDSMEGIKLKDGFSVDEDAWLVALTPSGNPVIQDDLIWYNGDEEKVRQSDDEKQSVLRLKYDFTENNEQVSIVYPISERGVDYSRKDEFECWVYGDGSNVKLRVDLGVINEDADQDGNLDTEDVNANGILNSGEDIGWIFNGWKERIGDNNGKIDSEDLDGDGILDTMPDYVVTFDTFTVTDENGNEQTADSISWTGRRKLAYKLNIDENETIKQIRITLEGSKGKKGEIWIGEMGVVGNKWQKEDVTGEGSFEIKAINGIDDKGYYDYLSADETSDHYNSEYKHLYENINLYSYEEENEQALALIYNLKQDSTGFATLNLSSKIDISRHKSLNFFLYGDNNNERFIFRIGTESDYFQYKTTVNWQGWKIIKLELVDSDKDKIADRIEVQNGTPGEINIINSPSLSNITEVKVGIIGNNTSGEVWVNEIFLDGVRKKIGYAYRVNVDNDLPGWGSFGGGYRNVDRNFETITTPSKNQDSKTYNGYINLTKLNILPISAKASRSITVTPPHVESDLVSVKEEGTTESWNWSGNATLQNIKNIPKISGSYSHEEKEYNPSGYSDDRDEFYYRYGGNVSYRVPLRIFFLPEDLSYGYTRNEKKVRYDKEVQGHEKSFEWTDSYSGRLTLKPFPKPFPPLTVVPSSSYTEEKQKKEYPVKSDKFYERIKSRNWVSGIDVSMRIFQWLNPKLNYNATLDENYNINITTGSSGKDFTRSISGSVFLPLNFNYILPWFGPIRSLSIDSSYKIEDGDRYDDIDETFKTIYLPYLITREGKVLNSKYKKIDAIKEYFKSSTSKNTINLSSSWKPLDYISFKGVFYPLKTISTRLNYNKIDSFEETTGTKYTTKTKIFPDIETTINSLEKIPPFGLFTKDFTMKGTYKMKTIDKTDISISTSTTITGNWKFRIIKDLFILNDFSSIIDYSYDKSNTFDITQQKVSSEGYTKTVSSSLSFRVLNGWKWIYKYSSSYNSNTTNEKEEWSRTIDHNVKTEGNVRIGSLPQPVTLRCVLDWQIKKSSVEKENFSTLAPTVSGDYSIGNFVLTFTLNASYYHSYKLSQDDYLSYSISGTGTLRF